MNTVEFNTETIVQNARFKNLDKAKAFAVDVLGETSGDGDAHVHAGDHTVVFVKQAGVVELESTLKDGEVTWIHETV